MGSFARRPLELPRNYPSLPPEEGGGWGGPPPPPPCTLVARACRRRPGAHRGGQGDAGPQKILSTLSALAGTTPILEAPAPKLPRTLSSSVGTTAFFNPGSGLSLQKWYKNHRKTYGFCMILNIRTEATLRRFSCAFEATPDPTKTPQDPQKTHPEHPRTPTKTP